MSGGFTDWHGHFYRNDTRGLYGDFSPPRTRSSQFGPFMRLAARLPWESDIAVAAERYPDHAGLLAEWERVWNASQPDWLARFEKAPEFITHRNGPFQTTPVPEEQKLTERVKLLKEVAGRRPAWQWIEARHLMSYFEAVRDAGAADAVEDPSLEVLRSAAVVLSMRHLVPQTAVVYVGGDNYLLTSHTPDGAPVLELINDRDPRQYHPDGLARMFNVLPSNCSPLPRYWRIAELEPFMPGHVVETYGGDEGRDTAEDCADSLLYASAVAADMAMQGFERVTVRKTDLMMFAQSPERSVVNIHGCTDPIKAREALLRDVRSPGSWQVALEPFFPAAHKLRLFAIDGRLVGSSSLDRSLPPRVGEGAFDGRVYDVEAGTSVDRPDIAANLERSAEHVVRILKDNGVTEYALDMQVSGTRVVIEDVIPLPIAETLSIDPGHLAKHAGEMGTRQLAELEEIARRIAIEFPPYTEILNSVIQELGVARLAQCIAASTYAYDSNLEDAVRGAYREFFDIVNRSARGLFEEGEKVTLGLTDDRRRNSAIHDWMYSRAGGYDFIIESIHRIAEMKGGALRDPKNRND